MYNLYRTDLNSIANDKIDNRKKKLIADDDPQHIGVLFFEPNLTNEGFKERQGDPPFLHRVERGIRIL